MSGGTTEIHRDDTPLATGTHKGADGASELYDPGADFRSCGVSSDAANYCENETQGTGGLVTASDENHVTASGVSWNNGDTYNIYVTSTKNSLISTQWVDRSRGWKSDKDELIDGWREEDIDIDDRGRKKVFGPGQPEKAR